MKAATPASGKLRTITMAEVEKHATKESVWFVRGGKARPVAIDQLPLLIAGASP